MTKYRKKPVVIEAAQWFKHGDHPEVRRVLLDEDEHPTIKAIYTPENGWIKTLEGGHVVTPGDWIIKGVKGEFYPCKPDIFDATYEPEATRPEVVANDELSRQLDHVAFNIMSHSPMTGTEARIVTKAARALESTRSPLVMPTEKK